MSAVQPSVGGTGEDDQEDVESVDSANYHAVLLVVYGDIHREHSLLEWLRTSLEAEDWCVLAVSLRNFPGELPPGLAPNVDVVFLSPTALETIERNDGQGFDFFAEGDWTYCPEALLLPDLALIECVLATHDELAVPSINCHVSSGAGYLGSGELHLTLVGPTILCACLEYDKSDDGTRGPLDDSVLSMFVPDEQVVLRTSKYAADQTDALIAAGSKDALNFAVEQWQRLDGDKGMMSTLSINDIAHVCGCSGTVVSQFLKGKVSTNSRQCRDGQKSTLQKIVYPAVLIKAMPTEPFAHLSNSTRKQLSIMKKKFKKQRSTTGSDIMSKSSTSNSGHPLFTWKWSPEEKIYLEVLARRQPGARCSPQFKRAHRMPLLMRHYNEHKSNRLPSKYECDETTTFESLDRAFKNWWTGTGDDKGPAFRLRACQKGVKQDPDLFCGIKACPKCNPKAVAAENPTPSRRVLTYT